MEKSKPEITLYNRYLRDLGGNMGFDWLYISIRNTKWFWPIQKKWVKFDVMKGFRKGEGGHGSDGRIVRTNQIFKKCLEIWTPASMCIFSLDRRIFEPILRLDWSAHFLVIQLFSGVARISSRRGPKCMGAPRYPLPKTVNSSDLVHYFL